jgi:hypothetical protein
MLFKGLKYGNIIRPASTDLPLDVLIPAILPIASSYIVLVLAGQ